LRRNPATSIREGLCENVAQSRKRSLLAIGAAENSGKHRGTGWSEDVFEGSFLLIVGGLNVAPDVVLRGVASEVLGVVDTVLSGDLPQERVAKQMGGKVDVLLTAGASVGQPKARHDGTEVNAKMSGQ
jgi:hypothetical protein